MEQWMTIIEQPNYEVSNEGRVRNIKTGRIIKNSLQHHRKKPNHSVYYRVCLRGIVYMVHRLVAEYFCHKPEGCNVIHHIDNNGLNNHYTNLIWTTQSHNVKMSYQDGLIKVSDRIGTKNHNYKNGKHFGRIKDGKYVKVKDRIYAT